VVILSSSVLPLQRAAPRRYSAPGLRAHAQPVCRPPERTAA